MAATVEEEWKWNLNVKKGSANENDVKVVVWDADSATPVVNTTTSKALSAAISEDNAVFTDETTDANNDTANDVTLMPTPAASTDRFYVGYSSTFNRVEFNIGTAGAGTYTLAWTYYNGSTWATLDVTDDTSDFKTAGRNDVSFTPPNDWATTTVNSQGPFYYIRCTRDTGTQTTQPLGTQCFINPGDISEQEIQEAVYSNSGTGWTTDDKTPHTISVVKWLNVPLPLTISFIAARQDTFFVETDSYITQTTKATVDVYTGITISHVTDTITLDGGGGTPVNTMAMLYDYCATEAYDSPQKDFPGGILTTTDGLNFTCEYDLEINGFTFNGQDKSIAMASGKDITFGTTGKANDLNMTSGDAYWNTATTVSDLDNADTFYFDSNVSLTATDCQFDTLDTVAGETVTLTLAGTSSYVTNNDPTNITIILNPVDIEVHADDPDGNDLQNARVALWAADGTGIYPFEETVSITRSGSTATVSHTAHGMSTGDYVKINKTVDQVEYSGIHQITYIDTNSYSYTVSGTPATPATGTIKATGGFLAGLTDVNGDISRSRAVATNTPVKGFIRKSTASPRLRTYPLEGNVVTSASGLTVIARMISDE